MKLPVHVRHGESRVQAYCPDLPGCSATAPSLEAALELLRARIDAYFAASAHRAVAGTRILTIEV